MNVKGIVFALCILAGLSIGLPSCELAVDVDVPYEGPKLVINSLFNPDSTWHIKVAKSRFILDKTPFSAVKTADVKISDEGGNEFLLRHFSEGSYRANWKPVAGQKYRVSVSAPTYNNVESTASTPVSVPIEGIFLDSANIIQSSQQVIGSIPTEITFTDPAVGPDFYYLSVQQLSVVTYKHPATNEEVTDTITHHIPLSIGDPLFDDQGPSGYFDDVKFDGQKHNLKVYVATNATTGGTSGNPIPPGVGAIVSKRLFRVFLLHASDEYYRYWITVDLQAAASGNPFAQPVQVYGNIENGFGIFAGFTRSVRTIGTR